MTIRGAATAPYEKSCGLLCPEIVSIMTGIRSQLLGPNLLQSEIPTKRPTALRPAVSGLPPVM